MRIGREGAAAALSNLVTSTPEQEAALGECLLAASLGDGRSAEPRVLACLTERLGGVAARVVASGLLPRTDGESAVLGECVLDVSTSKSGGAGDPIVACLEKSLDRDLARAVASGAVPMAAEQETLLGYCVLSSSLGNGETSVSRSVVACLEGALGVESARMVALSTGSLTEEQQAALGTCLLESSLETRSTTVSRGIMACLEEQLGSDVALLVASAALPLIAGEEQVLGNCVLKDVLGLIP